MELWNSVLFKSRTLGGYVSGVVYKNIFHMKCLALGWVIGIYLNMAVTNKDRLISGSSKLPWVFHLYSHQTTSNPINIYELKTKHSNL